MRFKVGDKVKLVRTDNEESYYKNYLGKIYTICNFGFAYGEKYAHFEETGYISPYLKNLELVKKEYTYEDLKKSPIGTKVTFENGKVLVKDDEDRYENSETYRYNEDLEGIKDNSDFGKIIKIEEPKYETVYEAKTEILDEAEKRYLRKVIKPFRDNVKYIEKVFYTDNGKQSKIKICSEMPYKCEGNTFFITNYTYLPPFFTDKMYKGMELEKEYTLEELGL